MRLNFLDFIETTHQIKGFSRLDVSIIDLGFPLL